MAATLTEPAVLTATKDTLYPDLTTTDQYVVTETQFTTANWGGWEIPAEVRRQLARIIRFDSPTANLICSASECPPRKY